MRDVEAVGNCTESVSLCDPWKIPSPFAVRLPELKSSTSSSSADTLRQDWQERWCALSLYCLRDIGLSLCSTDDHGQQITEDQR